MWVHGADIVWRYFDIGASVIWAVSGALLAAIITIAVVALLRGGSVGYGFRTHAARGLVEVADAPPAR